MFSDISWTIWILGPMIGFIGMTAGGFWGVGCGWIIVPFMIIMGLNPMEAVGIALLQMVPSTIPTVWKSAPDIGWQKKGLGMRIIVPMAAGAFIMSFSGRFINDWMYHQFGSSALMILFAIVMVITGLQTLFSRAVEYEKEIRTFSRLETLMALLSGLAAGVFSSVLGVGGALLMRPILASGFKVPERQTFCSIRLLLLVTTFVGGMNYVYTDAGIDWRIIILAALIAAGGLVGFPYGAKIHDTVQKAGYTQVIHRSFAFVNIVVIVNTVLKLCGLAEFSRYLMLTCAMLLLISLVVFEKYAKTHPYKGNTL